MIENGISVIKTAFERATGTGEYIILYLVALIFAYAFIKEKNNKSLIVNYAIVSILIIFNPIVAHFLGKFINMGSNVYWRLFWAIPLGITIAYMFTEIIFLSDSNIKRIVLTTSAIMIIIYSGTLIYTENIFQKVNNWFKIPDDELLAINIILNEKEENPKIFVPTEMVAHVRQIDTSIRLAYNRNSSGDYTKNAILNCFNENKIKEATDLLIKEKCDYLVWRNNVNIEETINIKLLSTAGNYNIYKLYR